MFGNGVSTSSSSSRQRLTRDEAFGMDEDLEGFRADGRRSGDQQVSSFTAAGGARGRVNDGDSRRSKQAPLVIRAQSDADWMADRRRRLGGVQGYRRELEGEGEARRAMNGGGGGQERIGDGQQPIGLVVRERRADDGERQQPITSTVEQPQAERMDEDSAARAALLGNFAVAEQDRPVIRMADQITEEEALSRDTNSRPDPPTIADYVNMPVDQFGAALLRGMGWKEGMGAGRQRQGPTSAPEVSKRGALLGLGAKQRPQTWSADQAKDRGRELRPERRYVPVTRQAADDGGGGRQQRSRSPPSRREHRSDPSDRRRDEQDRRPHRSYDRESQDKDRRYAYGEERDRSRSSRSEREDRRRHGDGYDRRDGDRR